MSPTDVAIACAIVTVLADVVAIVTMIRTGRALRAAGERIRQERRELLDVARRVMESTDAAIALHRAPPAPLVLPGDPSALWPAGDGALGPNDQERYELRRQRE